MSDEFVFDYVAECTKDGAANAKSICEMALVEIRDLEEEISKGDIARARRFNLIKVLKHFSHESVHKVRNSKISPVANLETAEVSVSSATEELMGKICEYVNAHNECTAEEILRTVGDYKHNEATFSSIKILCQKGILSQQPNRTLIKGESWEDI